MKWIPRLFLKCFKLLILKVVGSNPIAIFVTFGSTKWFTWFIMKKTSLIYKEEEFAFQVKLDVHSNDKWKHILKKLS
jgi:hypothetical protein